jgi:hypothetical protein
MTRVQAILAAVQEIGWCLLWAAWVLLLLAGLRRIVAP